MARVIFMSRHHISKSEEEIIHHLHGKQLKIELNTTRWEHQCDFESFVAEHQRSDVHLYVVGPSKFLMYAMARHFHFYIITNNGNIEVHEIKNGKIERIYQRKKRGKRTRYFKRQ